MSDLSGTQVREDSLVAELPLARLQAMRHAAHMRPAAVAEHATTALAAAAWVLVVTPARGGMDGYQVLAGLLTLLLAGAFVRPWRTVQRRVTILTLAACLGALVVLATQATGWSQADAAGAVLAGFGAFIVLAGYARTRRRRGYVVTGCAVAVVVQFLSAWYPWWGSRDPNHLMVGTFFWHNQLAAYMAGFGLLVAAAGMRGRGWTRAFALGVAALGFSSVVLSSSRTCMLLLAAGWLSLGALLAGAPRRRAAVAAWLSLPIATATLLMVMTSPLFFDEHTWHGPTLLQSASSTDAIAGDRSIGSADSNGRNRLTWTGAALAMFSERPLTGQGFGSFAVGSADHVASDSLDSAWPHDGYAEALSSGGLVWGGPVILATLGLVVVVVGTLRRRRTRNDPVLYGAAVGTCLLLAHSAVDFDWHYPSLVVALAVTGALLYAGGRPEPAVDRPPPGAGLRRPWLAGAVAVCSTLALAGVTTAVERHGREAMQHSAGGTPTLRALALLNARFTWAPDPRLPVTALNLAISRSSDLKDRLQVAPDVARATVSATASFGAFDPQTQLQRAEVLGLVGDDGVAARLAGETLKDHSHRSDLWAPYLLAMAAAGRYDDARTAVSRAILHQAKGTAADTPSWTALAVLQTLDPTSGSGATYCAYESLTARTKDRPDFVHPMRAPAGAAAMCAKLLS